MATIMTSNDDNSHHDDNHSYGYNHSYSYIIVMVISIMYWNNNNKHSNNSKLRYMIIINDPIHLLADPVQLAAWHRHSFGWAAGAASLG